MSIWGNRPARVGGSRGLITDWKPTLRIALVPQDVPATQAGLFGELGTDSGGMRCKHEGTGRETQVTLTGSTDRICSECGETVEA